jgi:hypothetical protein
VPAPVCAPIRPNPPRPLIGQFLSSSFGRYHGPLIVAAATILQPRTTHVIDDPQPNIQVVVKAG